MNGVIQALGLVIVLIITGAVQLVCGGTGGGGACRVGGWLVWCVRSTYRWSRTLLYLQQCRLLGEPLLAPPLAIARELFRVDAFAWHGVCGGLR